MTIDLVNFTLVSALVGGGMIGLAALALMASSIFLCRIFFVLPYPVRLDPWLNISLDTIPHYWDI